MTVRPSVVEADDEDGNGSVGMDGVLEARTREEGGVKMRNHWVTAAFAVLVWVIITVMNIANLVLLGLGK